MRLRTQKVSRDGKGWNSDVTVARLRPLPEWSISRWIWMRTRFLNYRIMAGRYRSLFDAAYGQTHTKTRGRTDRDRESEH